MYGRVALPALTGAASRMAGSVGTPYISRLGSFIDQANFATYNQRHPTIRVTDKGVFSNTAPPIAHGIVHDIDKILLYFAQRDENNKPKLPTEDPLCQQLMNISSGIQTRYRDVKSDLIPLVDKSLGSPVNMDHIPPMLRLAVDYDTICKEIELKNPGFLDQLLSQPETIPTR